MSMTIWLYLNILTILPSQYYMLTRGLSDRSDFAFSKCIDQMFANGIWMQVVNATNYSCIRQGTQELIQCDIISSNIIIPLLRVTIRSNCTCKFSLHVKAKLNEANNNYYLKPIFIFIMKLIFIRSLCKEEYTQGETDVLFSAIVLSKIMYGLPVYMATISDLTSVQSFLTRCHQRRFASVSYNVNNLLEKSDHCLFFD